LIKSSVERSSEVKSAPIKTLDDYEDLEQEPGKLFSPSKKEVHPEDEWNSIGSLPKIDMSYLKMSSMD